MEKDYYKILGVDKNASDEEIKKAYRKKAMATHPDRQVGKSDEEKKKAEESFKLANEAFSVLGDKEKRANYDRFGTADVNQGFGGSGFNPFEFFRSHMAGMGGFNPFGDFDDDFSGFGFCRSQNHAHSDPNGPKDGKDVRIKVNLPLEFSLYGTTKEFNVRISDPCDHCNGTGSDDGKYNACPQCGGSGMFTQRRGMMMIQTTCPSCHGTGHAIAKHCHVCGGSGTVENVRHIKIDIPQGIENGECLVVPHEGIKGTNGGKNGDMQIMVVIGDNELFSVEGLNLHTEAYVSSVKASLGGTVDVMTPWGTAKLKIPQYTQNGKVFRISGKGRKTKNGIGDLYVKINVEPLVNLTYEQIELLEKLDLITSDSNLKNTTELKRKYGNFEKTIEGMNR